jgi:outer membrane protein OmpA-like peptidoglycan-associated protein
MTPLRGRVSNTEERVDQMGNRVSGTEALIGHVDAKAEKALSGLSSVRNGLSNLRLERRFVLDLKEGANFAFDSRALTDQAKREIDSFFSDLKGDLEGTSSTIFLVAGHTDNAGPEDYNYELGKKRAEGVARYLITQRKIDPLRVVTVSYGKSAPLANNGTREGRSKNRRVEILVYKEAIDSASAGTGPGAGAKAPVEPQNQISAK